MTIKIKGNEFKIKQTLRAIFLWEQISERNFEIKSMLDNYLYFYCVILANNPDFMSWDEFIDAMDEDPSIILNLSKALTQQTEVEKLLNPDKDKNVSEDKKKD